MKHNNLSNTMKKNVGHTNTTAIILAAGLGSRMKSQKPKVMHEIGGLPMINHIINTLNHAGIEKKIVIVSNDMQEVTSAVTPYPTIIQSRQLGTGHAVKTALKLLKGNEENVLILFGADPLISSRTIKKLINRRKKQDKPSVVALGFTPTECGQYGRIIADNEGVLKKIIEAKDASYDELAINLCNSGVMVINGAYLKEFILSIKNRNAKAEYYLTDVVEIATRKGHICCYIEGSEDELIGVDTMLDLAKAENLFQCRARENAMADGISLIDPKSVFFSWDTKIGKDVTIGPNVFFGPGVTIRDNVVIKAFCHIEGALISYASTNE